MSTTYKIGEAATLLNLKTYVLRFWETEFPDIAPLRTEKGQRVYTEEHVALLERIKYLLHERGLTISGARKILEEEKARGIIYAFDRPSALSPTAAWSPGHFTGEPDGTSMREVSPVPAETGDVSVELPHFQKVAQAVAAALDRAASSDPPPIISGHYPKRTVASRKPAQHNLPGLEEIVAFHLTALDSQSSPEYAFSRKSQEDLLAEPSLPSELSLDTKGVVPLFTTARTMASTEQTSASGSFIQAGSHCASGPLADSLTGALSADELPAPDAREREAEQNGRMARQSSSSLDCLREIMLELESLAVLLRRSKR